MAPRPFLVSGGEEDPPTRWKTLQHAIAVNRILGVEGRVAMTNRPMHSLLTNRISRCIGFLSTG